MNYKYSCKLKIINVLITFLVIVSLLGLLQAKGQTIVDSPLQQAPLQIVTKTIVKKIRPIIVDTTGYDTLTLTGMRPGNHNVNHFTGDSFHLLLFRLSSIRSQRPSADLAPRLGLAKMPLSKDALFYAITGLVFLLAIFKSAFGKYYQDLFTVFFRSSLRQHQIREQLIQARLPSLLFNVFFVLCAGTLLYLLAARHELVFMSSEWQLWLLAIGGVMALYLCKFIGLKLSGWIFGIDTAVDTYVFIVFLVNKIMGVALLPLVILVAFAREPLQSISVTLALVLIFSMLIYRFIRSYRPVREEVQMSQFHFFLYLCAFEIAPLLLIYKTLLKLL